MNDKYLFGITVVGRYIYLKEKVIMFIIIMIIIAFVLSLNVC